MASSGAYDPYNDVLPCLFAFAQRARAAAAILALAAALILRRPFLGAFAGSPFCFAHLALCAAAILARAAALIFRVPPLGDVPPDAPGEPAMRSN